MFITPATWNAKSVTFRQCRAREKLKILSDTEENAHTTLFFLFLYFTTFATLMTHFLRKMFIINGFNYAKKEFYKAGFFSSVRYQSFRPFLIKCYWTSRPVLMLWTCPFVTIKLSSLVVTVTNIFDQGCLSNCPKIAPKKWCYWILQNSLEY